MNIITLIAGLYEENCYIVYHNNIAFIIDPGGKADNIIKKIDENKLKPIFIILTHAHFDHTGAVNKLKEVYNIPVYMNKNDLYLIEGYNEKDIDFFPLSQNIIIDKYLKENDIINFSDKYIKIIETPGHTKGSISILVDKHLFTGDTLFEYSIGRCDFPGGSYNEIIDSIKNKLFTLSEDIIVYPGHGNLTTIGKEKTNNPYF